MRQGRVCPIDRTQPYQRLALSRSRVTLLPDSDLLEHYWLEDEKDDSRTSAQIVHGPKATAIGVAARGAQFPRACVKVTCCPAIVTTPCLTGPVFFAMLSLMGPLPTPLGVTTLIQLSPVVTAHEHPVDVVSPNSTSPPSLPTCRVGMSRVYTQRTPSCTTR